MRFQYIAPKTIQEAAAFLVECRQRVKIIAGGTDLLLQMQNGAVQAEFVMDIQHITQLDYIQFNENTGLRIGANTTLRALENSAPLRQAYPVISDSARNIASVAIRNVATIGGNLCNASPSADMAPALICLSAAVKVVSATQERMVPIEDFFIGPGKTSLKPGELMAEVRLPPMPENSASTYLKHTTRGSVDLAMVGVAVLVALDGLSCRDIRIGLGAVAPTPMRAKTAEAAIIGKAIDDESIKRAAALASDESRPISDARASKTYRKAMVKVLTRRALQETLNGLHAQS